MTGQEMSGAGKEVREVPNDVSSQTEVVYLEWNQIAVIRTSSFSHLRAREKLALDNNKIHIHTYRCYRFIYDEAT